MVFRRTIDPHPLPEGPWCIHLRSKGMYVREDFNTTDPYESNSGHFWCLVNQHVFGPDNVEVGRETCIAGRACYCDKAGQWPPEKIPAPDPAAADHDADAAAKDTETPAAGETA